MVQYLNKRAEKLTDDDSMSDSNSTSMSSTSVTLEESIMIKKWRSTRNLVTSLNNMSLERVEEAKNPLEEDSIP